MNKKATPGGAASSVALAPDFDEIVEAAVAGDPHAWGRLYGMAGALLGAGHALPDPLQRVISERLAAMSGALTKRPLGDVRAALADVVVPTSTLRVYGPKKAAVTKLRMAAMAALDMMGDRPARGRKKAVVDQVAAIVGVDPESIDREIGKIRAERRQKPG